ncbi:hypothetical protein F5888DRAFT_897753 [Russula emetica]|nr:hypothetical protein F5888DRAFT_897753 [Russula emetica]
MMSTTLVVVPSRYQQHGPVPLPTKTLDNLTATERAACIHSDAPPRLSPLPFTDHAEEISRILFAPELIAPPPIIWWSSDNAGVARAEARDLEQFHGLKAVIAVRSTTAMGLIPMPTVTSALPLPLVHTLSIHYGLNINFT